MARLKMNLTIRQKKALFFTIDALIAALIFMTGLLLITNSYVNDQPTVTLHYLVQDMLSVMGELEVGEINNSYVSELITNGTIDNLNNTLLEQMGEFWASGETGFAEDFVRETTEGLIPEQYAFGVYIDYEAIYKSSDIPEDNVVVARKIISGIEKDKPLNGFMARAIAHEVTRNMTKITSFSPEGSGWYSNGYVQITKQFNLSGSINLESARFFFSGHIGTGTTDVRIEFNDDSSCVFDRDNITLIREESANGRGYYGYFDVPFDCIISGINSVEIRLRNSAYNGHIHPGAFLKLRYIDNDYIVTEIESTVSERIYMDDIVSYGSSNNGIFQVVPFFLPADATDVSVAVQVVTRNATDYTGSSCCDYAGWSCVLRCRDIDYQAFLNSDVAFDIDSSPAVDNTYKYTPAQTAGNLVDGTNILGLYVNSYGDDRWGSMPVQLYSDMENDPENSSYIEVNYSFVPQIQGGTVEIVIAEQFGGGWTSPNEGSFSFPDEAEWVSEVYAHGVQIFSAFVRAEAGTTSPPATEIFLSPDMRLVPTTIYIPLTVLSTDSAATNYISLEDTYGSPRDFGPNSTIEYGFYVKSFVGYGDVFSTMDAAVDDAEDRLEDVVGQYVALEDVEFDNISLTDVPSLWGPAVIGVHIWN